MFSYIHMHGSRSGGPCGVKRSTTFAGDPKRIAQFRFAVPAECMNAQTLAERNCKKNQSRAERNCIKILTKCIFLIPAGHGSQSQFKLFKKQYFDIKRCCCCCRVHLGHRSPSCSLNLFTLWCGWASCSMDIPNENHLM